jgi:hypothetical protein
MTMADILVDEKIKTSFFEQLDIGKFSESNLFWVRCGDLSMVLNQAKKLATTAMPTNATATRKVYL